MFEDCLKTRLHCWGCYSLPGTFPRGRAAGINQQREASRSPGGQGGWETQPRPFPELLRAAGPGSGLQRVLERQTQPRPSVCERDAEDAQQERPELVPARWLGRLDGWFSVTGRKSLTSRSGSEGLAGEKLGTSPPPGGWGSARCGCPLRDRCHAVFRGPHLPASELQAGQMPRNLGTVRCKAVVTSSARNGSFVRWVNWGSHLASSEHGDPNFLGLGCRSDGPAQGKHWTQCLVHGKHRGGVAAEQVALGRRPCPFASCPLLQSKQRASHGRGSVDICDINGTGAAGPAALCLSLHGGYIPQRTSG